MTFSFDIVKFNAILSSNFDNSLLQKYVNEPDLSHISVIQRRRLSKSAKLLFSSLKNFNLENTPIVFSSRYGEINRCFELLGELSICEPLSPTSFSLSVHNATTSLHNIFTKNHGEISAISSTNSLENALLDGYLKLDENTQQVLVISHFEAPMQEFLHVNEFYILAIMIQKGTQFCLKQLPNNSSKDNFSSSIEFLKNYELKNKTWKISDKNSFWQWTNDSI